MYKDFASIYDVTDIQTLVKRIIQRTCWIDEKKHVAQ